MVVCLNILQYFLCAILILNFIIWGIIVTLLLLLLCLQLPLSRSVGFARTVGVEWIARPLTAGNEDFFPKSASVEFKENQAAGEIEIFITDDDEVEFLETFTVQLVGTTGRYILWTLVCGLLQRIVAW